MQWARVPLGPMQLKLLSQADSVNLKSRLWLDRLIDAETCEVAVITMAMVTTARKETGRSRY